MSSFTAQTSDWSRSDLLSLVGVLVSLCGFLFAGGQLVRTARASETTTRAVRAANRGYLLLLLPQFRLFEVELDFALDNDNRGQAARILSSCAHLASEVAGLLQANPSAFEDAPAEVVTELGTVADAASRAKAAIYDSPNKKLVVITHEFRDAYTSVIRTIGLLQMSGHQANPSA